MTRAFETMGHASALPMPHPKQSSARDSRVDKMTSKRQTLRAMSSEEPTKSSPSEIFPTGRAEDLPVQNEPSEDEERPRPFNLPLKTIRGQEAPYDSKRGWPRYSENESSS